MNTSIAHFSATYRTCDTMYAETLESNRAIQLKLKKNTQVSSPGAGYQYRETFGCADL